ncbi:MAG TPA: vanadium-dependent haloperoxidase, partial [Casimicrobiaceae bacterium]
MASSSFADGFNGSFRDALGPRFEPVANLRITPARRDNASPIDPHATLRYWNQIAVNASGLDHTPVASGEARVFGEQFGPGRASRAMAIVHIAIFDAVNAIAGGYRSYTSIAPAAPNTAMNAAIAQAAHDTLVALYPSQRASFDALLDDDLGHMLPRGRPQSNGVALGAYAAAAILALRADDGSQQPESRIGIDYVAGLAAGDWRQDPIGLSPLALGYHWGAVKPFVLQSGDQFRVPSPPSMTSADYAAAYAEVKRVGGDGATPTSRTADQTEIGIYWAYDGTPALCAPPRLYNQITAALADQMRTDAVDLARLLALVNVAMADAGTAIWESKYFYDFWRPVTGIRESDPGTGPSGSGDGNAATIGDPSFTPLGAPASNLHGPNFTPPFPSYPSGHAGFGGALFQTLRNFYRTDAIAFTFVSDELDGTTLDHEGNARPLVPRSFTSLSQAEE